MYVRTNKIVKVNDRSYEFVSPCLLMNCISLAKLTQDLEATYD